MKYKVLPNTEGHLYVFEQGRLIDHKDFSSKAEQIIPELYSINFWIKGYISKSDKGGDYHIPLLGTFSSEHFLIKDIVENNKIGLIKEVGGKVILFMVRKNKTIEIYEDSDLTTIHP